MSTLRRLCVLAAMAVASAGVGEAQYGPDFERQIRPLLAERCLRCHGPGADPGKTSLRLDTREAAVAELDDGGYAIVPGRPEQSELVRRITSDDPEVRMPPARKGLPRLEDDEIDLLRGWIADGAPWEAHWAFTAPRRTLVPRPLDSGWITNPIDAFVLERLEQEELRPSEPAERSILIRRVTLDLTGLPPTIEEVEAYLADESENAYEKVVDRLLASPRYGERMAFRWLGHARYADTNGYQEDRARDMWRWRDWVIEAFNDNMPFDQFTIEQLAGDLLDNPSLDQQIASGFNRNHRGNSENGVDPDEFVVEYAVDRAQTTATVWLGLTMECARCHDHKYDPISQKEYYEFLAFFNNVSDRGRYFKFGNTPPVVPAPTREQQAELAELDARIAVARELLEDASRSAAEDAKNLLARAESTASWSFDERRLGRWTFDRRGARHSSTDGVSGLAVELDGRRSIELGDAADLDFDDAFTLSAWVRPASADGGIISRYESLPLGYGLFLVDRKLQLRFDTPSISDRMRIETTKRLPLGRWTHVAASYDGSRLASGMRLFLNGGEADVSVLVDESLNSTRSTAPLRIGQGPEEGQYLAGALDDIRVYGRALDPDQIGVIAVAETVRDIAALPAAERTVPQQSKLRAAWLDPLGPQSLRRDLELAREDLVASFPTVMVMNELGKRPTHVLSRGSYLAPGAEVSAGAPSVLPPLGSAGPASRLDLARWLTEPSHPLTSRVTVNRFWLMLFGRGLVASPENFGTQGAVPTHRELLDWLAVELVERGWDVKSLLKTIVMSSTYRQTSRSSPEQLERDPQNRLLARMPRLRLPAEAVRDQALAVAGLLVEELGGPPVKPYQPPGLWEELANEGPYERDRGDGLYRRSLYTFWKRTLPPPAMLLFDSAPRETCSVGEERTNTPIQALNLMNDVTYVEASRVLAERMIRDGGPGKRQRLVHGFRLATSRWPDSKETEILLRALHRYGGRYAGSPAAAERLLRHGDRPRDRSIPAPELAAYTVVASMLLNLDEVITRE